MLLIATIAIVLSSCSAERRLQRLLDKHPELIAKDTVVFRDTVITKEHSVDSIFSLKHILEHDTITVFKDKIKVRIVNHNDSVYVYAKSSADTVFIEKKIPVDKVINKHYLINPKTAIIALLLFIALAILIIWARGRN